MKPKFKIGDKVRCINKGTKSNYWELDKLFVIDEMGDFEEKEFYYMGDEARGGIWENSLELSKVTNWKQVIENDN